MKIANILALIRSLRVPEFLRTLRPRHWLVMFLATFLLVFQYRLWFGEGSVAQREALEVAVLKQEARNGRLTERNRILAEEVEGLRDDPGAVEERARADLGMVRSDETFFLVLETPQQPQAKRPEPKPSQEEAVDSIPEGLFEE